MKKIVSLVLAFMIPLSLGACKKEVNQSKANMEKLKTVSLPGEDESSLQLKLYFDSSKDEKSSEIAAEDRNVKKEELLGELIITELIKGPSRVSGLKPVLPSKAKLLGFSIKDNIAYVDFSPEASSPMTAKKEEICLKAIASSLTQLPSVKKVKILINHGDIKSLGGHYDMSKPFSVEDIQPQ